MKTERLHKQSCITDRRIGRVIIPHGVNVWSHELSSANALSGTGFDVEFLVIRNRDGTKTPGISMRGELWEIKSPKTDKLSAVERNLKKATKQSCNIIFDSQRMSKIHDSTIYDFLQKKLRQQKSIKKLIFINRKREVIDI
jgi:hypothetical protein